MRKQIQLFLLSVIANSLSATLFPAISFADEFPVTVIENYIDIRTGPGKGYPIFYVSEKGDKIILHKSRTDWIKITGRNGKIGWAHVNDINKTVTENGNLTRVDIPSLENYQLRTWEAGFSVGSYGGIDSVSVNLAKVLTNNITLEATAIQTYGRFSDSTGYSLALTHTAFPDWRASPFFLLGAGRKTTNPRSNLVSTEDRNDSVAMAGAGFKYYLTNRLVFRASYVFNTVLTSRDDDENVEEWNIGLSAYF